MKTFQNFPSNVSCQSNEYKKIAYPSFFSLFSNSDHFHFPIFFFLMKQTLEVLTSLKHNPKWIPNTSASHSFFIAISCMITRLPSITGVTKLRGACSQQMISSTQSDESKTNQASQKCSQVEKGNYTGNHLAGTSTLSLGRLRLPHKMDTCLKSTQSDEKVRQTFAQHGNIFLQFRNKIRIFLQNIKSSNSSTCKVWGQGSRKDITRTAQTLYNNDYITNQSRKRGNLIINTKKKSNSSKGLTTKCFILGPRIFILGDQ